MSAAETAFDEILSLDLAACTVAVCLASAPSKDDVPRFQSLQMSEGLAAEFRDVVAHALDERAKDAGSHDLVLHPYDAGSKPEPNEVEYVDLSAQPFIRDQLAALAAITDLEVFAQDQAFVAGLRFYVIVVEPPGGAPLYCFRSYTPRKEVGRSHWSLFAVMLSGNSFDRVREPLFLFDHAIDCLSRGDLMFVFNKSNFQHIFRFFALVQALAEETLHTIGGLDLIENVDAFAAACRGHLVKLAKLKNIAAKPYLAQIGIDDLKKVIDRYGVEVPITTANGREMLVYDARHPWAILNLLDDDYLESLMTGQAYEVSGKRARR